MFFRLNTDGQETPYDLNGLYASPSLGACWIIGGGVSLREIPVDLIEKSPVPKFGVNLAGSGLIRPNFWTSYDPTARFHRSVYLDPSIIKFLHPSRATDLIPESTYKVCEAPATLFFRRSRNNSFQHFIENDAETIPDWQDSFLQIIHLAYKLGFRTLYLAGCELFIKPSPQQKQLALSKKVTYQPRELLSDFFSRCEQAGLSQAELESHNNGNQYHFDESKSLKATILTDFHYFRVSQYLRLARLSLAQSGLNLISVTPESRLNDYFPCQTVEQVFEKMTTRIGHPEFESTRGLYTQQLDRSVSGLGPMRDFKPHFHDSSQIAPVKKTRRNIIDNLPEIPVHLNEQPG